MLAQELIGINAQLFESDYFSYIKYLYDLGSFLEKNFIQAVKGCPEEIFVCESDKRKRFYKYVSAYINERLYNFPPRITKEKLSVGLWNLKIFLVAWEDPELRSEEDKKQRQAIKFKADIDKAIRRAIHAGLIAEVARMHKQANDFLIKEKKIPGINFSSTDTTNQECINILTGCINSLSSETPGNIEQTFEKAARTISTFKPTADKFLYGIGIFIGVIAALACGLGTGGAIFVLLASFVPLGFVIPLTLIIFLAGTRANFQLFSQHMPQFLQGLCKSSGVTEFVDQQGKRLRLSAGKKFLLLPAAFFSVSVGIATAAITVLEGTKMIALICPMLTLACPYLPVILLGILASTLLIGLTVVMFRAFISILQSQFSWETLKKTINEKWQSLNWTKILAYALKALVMAVALFGLFFLSITGAPTLAASLGWTVAYGISLAAFIGDVPFTLATAMTFCTSLLIRKDPNPDLIRDKKYYLGQVMEFFALIVNALGNAALVFTGSWVSRAASIACFMNSYANNRVQDDDNELIQARAKATQKSFASLAQPIESEKMKIMSGRTFNPISPENAVTNIRSENFFFTPNSPASRIVKKEDNPSVVHANRCTGL